MLAFCGQCVRGMMLGSLVTEPFDSLNSCREGNVFTATFTGVAMNHMLHISVWREHAGIRIEVIGLDLDSWNSNPKTLGSIPWRGRVRSSFSVPPSQPCADLFVSDPRSCVWHAPKFVRTLKIPYPSVV